MNRRDDSRDPQATLPWTAERLADASGATVANDSGGSAAGFAIDSREAGPGDLFVGIPGERVDGGSFAAEVIAGGAWGAIVTPDHRDAAALAGGTVLTHPDPVAALGSIAAVHRKTLRCPVIGVTGSSGKTSTKDLLSAVLETSGRVVATRGNRNTEIGMPLEILRADGDTDFLILEMAMRGSGQIAELTRIARPTVGVIVSIGPAHLELLGSIEAIAAAKAELIAGLEPGSLAVLPAGEELLEPHIRTDLETVTFGEGGDVRLVSARGRELTVSQRGAESTVSVDFDQPHNRTNLLAALAVAEHLGVRPPRDLEVGFSARRGERIRLDRDVTLINDCYNANPSSVSAGLADLREEVLRRGGRSVAVLGDMLELGPQSERFHAELGAEAERCGVGLLVTVGPLAEMIGARFGGTSVHFADAGAAAAGIDGLLMAGDTVLVKGSRSVGLDAVTSALTGED